MRRREPLQTLEAEYGDYRAAQRGDRKHRAGDEGTQRRALVRIELEFGFVRRLFEEAVRQFEEQYGRDIEACKPQDQAKRVQEAFVADSAAALIARVLFLRLVEDLEYAAAPPFGWRPARTGRSSSRT